MSLFSLARLLSVSELLPVIRVHDCV